MQETKTEGGHTFRLAGLLGSAWHPELRLCLEGASFSNRHTDPANFSSSPPFLPHSFSHFLPLNILVFPLRCTRPLALLRVPRTPFGVSYIQNMHRYFLSYIYSHRLNKNGYHVTVIPFLFLPKSFPSKFLAERILLLAVMVDSGPTKQNGG